MDSYDDKDTTIRDQCYNELIYALCPATWHVDQLQKELQTFTKQELFQASFVREKSNQSIL